MKFKGCMAIVLCILIALCVMFFTAPQMLVYGPLMLLSKPWLERCEKDPINTYLSGSYAPCTGSPFTAKNVNELHHGVGLCPLLRAVGYRNVSAVEELLLLGAKPEMCKGFPDSFYNMVTDLSQSKSKNEITKLLSIFVREKITPSDPTALLFLSTKRTSKLTAEYAIKFGAKVNDLDNDGLPPLYYASLWGLAASDDGIELVRFLISKGANPRFKTPSGKTIFQLAKDQYEGKVGNWPKLERALLGKNEANDTYKDKLKL